MVIIVGNLFNANFFLIPKKNYNVFLVLLGFRLYILSRASMFSNLPKPTNSSLITLIS